MAWVEPEVGLKGHVHKMRNYTATDVGIKHLQALEKDKNSENGF